MLTDSSLNAAAFIVFDKGAASVTIVCFDAALSFRTYVHLRLFLELGGLVVSDPDAAAIPRAGGLLVSRC